MSLGSILLSAFLNSDTLGQGIVIILFAMSCWSWRGIILKYFPARSMRKQCENFQKQYLALDKSPLKVAGLIERNALQGPLAEICNSAIKCLRDILTLDNLQQYALTHDGVLPRRLTTDEINRIRATMNRTRAQHEHAMNDEMTTLAGAISISPLLGLFGTVWGVMSTFIGIVNNGGRPDIQAIAPGISSALLTTVAGLAVAIPASMAVISIENKNNATSNDMETLIDDFLASLNVCPLNPAQLPQSAAAPGLPQDV